MSWSERDDCERGRGRREESPHCAFWELGERVRGRRREGRGGGRREEQALGTPQIVSLLLEELCVRKAWVGESN